MKKSFKGNEVIMPRRWHIPNDSVGKDKVYISSADLRVLISQKLKGKLDNTFGFYIADTEYYCPSIEDAKEIIQNSSVDRYTWVRERFDCDDFAFVLKSHFAEAAYVNGLRRSAHCFGIVWGNLPKPHAINWMLNDDLELRFIEPQSDEIFLPRSTDKNIYFMLL